MQLRATSACMEILTGVTTGLIVEVLLGVVSMELILMLVLVAVIVIGSMLGSFLIFSIYNCARSKMNVFFCMLGIPTV